MNMTLEEVKLYHYRLWDEIVDRIPYNMDEYLYMIKDDALKEVRSKGLVPTEYPSNDCYLCEYYARCRICPLNGCDLYFTLMEVLREKDVKEAIALAKAIRDIYKIYDDKKEDEK